MDKETPDHSILLRNILGVDPEEMPEISVHERRRAKLTAYEKSKCNV